MKQFDEKSEFDETLKSIDSISMNEADKNEVYSKLMNSIQQKKSKNRVFTWSNHILSAAFVMLFLIGGAYFIANQLMVDQAAPQDKQVEAIEAVLNQSFSGPDQELKEILDKEESYIEEDNFQQYQAELLTYYEAVYQPYFAENRIQQYVMENKLTFNQLAYSNGYQLKVSKIDVKEDKDNEGAFDFTVLVQTIKGENDVDEIKVSGRINIDENGKINTIRYFDNGGLAELVKSIQSD
jgi:hypothetical protein